MARLPVNEKKYQIKYLEHGSLKLTLEERILISAQHVLDKKAKNHIDDKTLRDYQIPAFSNFGDYLMNLATSPANDSISPFCRIVLPPRTGKTVVAAKIINLTGLCSTFVVPTKALVEQTLKEMLIQIPNVPVGLYYSDKKELVENGINITTYATLQRHFFADRLPVPIINSALIFFDEAHHAMTSSRVKTMNEAFADKSIRIALTATPDYNENRQLYHFFPELVHELELFDAFDLGILAPARMWMVEVDTDASTVRLVAGEYEQDSLGRIMSSSPFFKAVQVFRYLKSNVKVPALISCTSRQQAYDLWNYLNTHRPPKSPKPGLILGETPSKERQRILRRFDQGKIDTLIQVGVLIEGWNAPRCKLLLDLAPSISRVRATQKYFRVMTRHHDDEARIVVILPKNLPRQPILPIDLMLKPGKEYNCGDLLKSVPDGKNRFKNPIDQTEQPTIKSVKLKSRVIASAYFAKPDLDPNDLRQIREVLTSCPAFKLKLRFGNVGFKRLFFSHPLFIGTGKALLRYLNIANGKKAYQNFLSKIFPDQFRKQVKENVEKSYHDDFQHIFQTALIQNNKKGKPQEPFISTLNSLCGGVKEIASPEEVLLMQEQVKIILLLLNDLNDREQQIIVKRLGLFGVTDLTWEKIGIEFDLSKERIRQIFLKAISKLRYKYLIKTRDRTPISRAIFEYPDLFELIEEPVQGR